MSDIDNVELHYQAIINKLENELYELRKEKERLDWLLNLFFFLVCFFLVLGVVRLFGLFCLLGWFLLK